MSIVVAHEPDAALVGGVAYQAGLGQYAQRRQQQNLEQAIRLAQISAQERESQQQISLQRQQQAVSTELAWSRHNFEVDQFSARAREVDAAQREAAARQQQGFEQNLALQQDRQQFAWGAGAVQDLESEVSARRASDSHRKFTPDGLRLQGDLVGKLRAIQRQRATLRPQQYNSLLGQWLAEYDRSGMQNYAIKEPTTDELWKQRTVPLGNGSLAVFQPDGKGGGTFDRFDAQASFLNDDKEYKSAAKSLADRKALENPDKPIPAGWEPPPHEVLNEMLKRKSEKDKIANLSPLIEALTQAGNEVVQVGADGRLLVKSKFVPGRGSSMQWIDPHQLQAQSTDDSVSSATPTAPLQRPLSVTPAAPPPAAARYVEGMSKEEIDRLPPQEQVRYLEGLIRKLMAKYGSYREMSTDDRLQLEMLKGVYDNMTQELSR